MDNLERRLKLHEKLCALFDKNPHVYFQPPESIRMTYPAIVYELSRKEPLYAGNIKYIHCDRFSVTIIDRDPDSVLRDRIEELDFCSFERHFVSDNLHHFVYQIYI